MAKADITVKLHEDCASCPVVAAMKRAKHALPVLATVLDKLDLAGGDIARDMGAEVAEALVAHKGNEETDDDV